MITVNPVKLRQKKLSLRSLCLYLSMQLKRYYHNIREGQFRNILRKAVKRSLEDCWSLRKNHDRLLSLLDLRLDGLLFKTGLFSHPQYLRHLNIIWPCFS